MFAEQQSEVSHTVEPLTISIACNCMCVCGAFVSVCELPTTPQNEVAEGKLRHLCRASFKKYIYLLSSWELKKFVLN